MADPIDLETRRQRHQNEAAIVTLALQTLLRTTDLPIATLTEAAVVALLSRLEEKGLSRDRAKGMITHWVLMVTGDE